MGRERTEQGKTLELVHREKRENKDHREVDESWKRSPVKVALDRRRNEVKDDVYVPQEAGIDEKDRVNERG